MSTPTDPWDRTSPATTYTNGQAIRIGLIPCDTAPQFGGLSRTVHPFHAVAEVTVGAHKGLRRHVCRNCAAAHHKHQPQVPGVVWE